MNRGEDLRYFRRRQQEELSAAARAPGTAAGRSHWELAKHYARKVRMLEEEEEEEKNVRPVPPPLIRNRPEE